MRFFSVGKSTLRNCRNLHRCGGVGGGGYCNRKDQGQLLLSEEIQVVCISGGMPRIHAVSKERLGKCRGVSSVVSLNYSMQIQGLRQSWMLTVDYH